MKIKLSTLLAMLTAGMLAVTSPSIAQTPDGETPAEEDVCSGLVGATPGLYGLCNAFCEAQDADFAFFSGDILAKTSHQKLLDNYNKRKKAGDPDMPCLRGACPCFNANDVATTGPFGVSCSISASSDTASYTGFDANDCRMAATVQPGNEFGTSSCFFRNDERSTDPKAAACVQDTGVVVDGLTVEEVQACKDAMLAAASQNGTGCKTSQ